jgi:hypothetical protein
MVLTGLGVLPGATGGSRLRPQQLTRAQDVRGPPDLPGAPGSGPAPERVTGAIRCRTMRGRASLSGSRMLSVVDAVVRMAAGPHGGTSTWGISPRPAWATARSTPCYAWTRSSSPSSQTPSTASPQVLGPGGHAVLTCWEPLGQGDERLPGRLRRGGPRCATDGRRLQQHGSARPPRLAGL